MDRKVETLVLGLGNVLWADEGFGVRAVEALHSGWVFGDDVRLMDGGTLGLNLFDDVASARRVLVFDAIDDRLPGGTLRVLRDAEVPAWGSNKLSPHQTGFNDVLALALLRGTAPEKITAVGVQPAVLDDFGGSLCSAVRARLPEAVELALRELAAWGHPATPRPAGSPCEPLNAQSLALDAYEAGRPTAAAACRVGDPRVLALAAPRGKRKP